MPWPFSRRSSQPCFSIGPYNLNGSIAGLTDLVALTAEELAALNSAIQFRGETIVHAPEVEFLGHRWEVVLGAVNDHIYKIALQVGGLSRSDGGTAMRSVLVYVTGQQRNKPKSEGAVYVWDAADGNVVFHDVWMGNQFVLNLFLTSSAVKTFQRL